jgi:predicted RNase H-like HicB family nuclease
MCDNWNGKNKVAWVRSTAFERRWVKKLHKFTAVYEKDGEWWIGYLEELPGANTQGHTLQEARENLKEAAELIIEANRELAQHQSNGKEVIREELLVAAE